MNRKNPNYKHPIQNRPTPENKINQGRTNQGIKHPRDNVREGNIMLSLLLSIGSLLSRQ